MMKTGVLLESFRLPFDYVLENQGMRFAEKEENYVKMPLYNIKM